MKTELLPANKEQIRNSLRFSYKKRTLCGLFVLIFCCNISCFETIAQTADSAYNNGSLRFSIGNGVSYAGEGDQSKAGWGLAIRASLGYEYKGLLVIVGAGCSAGGTVHYDEDWMNSNDRSICGNSQPYFCHHERWISF